MISEAEKSFLKTGFKEVLKIVAAGNAEKVFIAKDASPAMQDRLTTEISGSPCAVFYIETMKELGALSGISVGASCAAIIKH